MQDVGSRPFLKRSHTKICSAVLAPYLQQAFCFCQELERPSLEIDMLNTERTQKVSPLAPLRFGNKEHMQLLDSGSRNGSEWQDPSWRVFISRACFRGVS